MVILCFKLPCPQVSLISYQQILTLHDFNRLEHFEQIHTKKYVLVYGAWYHKFFFEAIQEAQFLKLDLTDSVILQECRSFSEFGYLIFRNNNSNLKYCGYRLKSLKCLHFSSILIRIDVVFKVQHRRFEWVWLFLQRVCLQVRRK